MNDNDKKALLSIQAELRFTDPRFSLGWSDEKDTSDWLGTTIRNGRVIALTLHRIGPAILSGSIPPAIGELEMLERLDMADNILSGSIPTAIGELPNLRYLNLENNQLTGEVPATLDCRNARKLRTLKLHDNQLTYSNDFKVCCIDCGAPAPQETEMCEDCDF